MAKDAHADLCDSQRKIFLFARKRRFGFWIGSKRAKDKFSGKKSEFRCKLVTETERYQKREAHRDVPIFLLRREAHIAT